MGYTNQKTAQMIADELLKTVAMYDVALNATETTEYDCRIVFDLPSDEHITVLFQWHRVAPLGAANDVFVDSLEPTRSQFAHHIEGWFKMRELKRAAQTLTPFEVATLRALKENGHYDPPMWMGDVNRERWDYFVERDKEIAAYQRLCDLGFARLHDSGIFPVTIVFDGRGADALALLDAEDS